MPFKKLIFCSVIVLRSAISIVQRVIISTPGHSSRVGGELPEVSVGGLGLEVVGEDVELGPGHRGLEWPELPLGNDHAAPRVHPGGRGHSVVLDLDPALDVVPHPVAVCQVTKIREMGDDN